MPKFAANLSLMFTEWDFLDRFGAAADAGFDAVEFQFPYAYRADEIARRLAAHGQICVLFNLPPGDLAAGDRGLAALPERVDEFRASLVRGARLRPRPRRPALAPDGRRRRSQRSQGARGLCRRFAPRRRRLRPRGRRRADRAAQREGQSRLLPRRLRRRRGLDRRARAGAAEAAIRHLPSPDPAWRRADEPARRCCRSSAMSRPPPRPSATSR